MYISRTSMLQWQNKILHLLHLFNIQYWYLPYFSLPCITCGVSPRVRRALSGQWYCVLLDLTCLVGMFMKRPFLSSFYHYGMYCLFTLSYYQYKTLSFIKINVCASDYRSIKFKLPVFRTSIRFLVMVSICLSMYRKLGSVCTVSSNLN